MNRKIFGMALSTLALAVCPILGNALVVTIEPDDYTLGADLSSVSQYVELRSISNLQSNPVFATASNRPGAAASERSFGSAGLSCRREPCGASDYDGFGMFFSQDVSEFSLRALNWGYDYGLPASWVAFDQSGLEIAFGYTPSLGIGESALIDIQVQGIRSVVIGGLSGIAALEFDQLRFEVEGVVAHVPEPTAIGLLGLGLLGFGFRSRFAKR